MERKSRNVNSVDSHTRVPLRRQEPSDACKASMAAPSPVCATRARSAATSSGDESARSRMTCQRMAGSESRSQLRVSTGLS